MLHQLQLCISSASSIPMSTGSTQPPAAFLRLSFLEAVSLLLVVVFVTLFLQQVLMLRDHAP